MQSSKESSSVQLRQGPILLENFAPHLRTADATPSLHIVAVHDDTWFCGPPAEAIAALHFCASPAGFRSIGGNMKLNFAKCLVYAPALDRWSPPYARSTLEEACRTGIRPSGVPSCTKNS